MKRRLYSLRIDFKVIVSAQNVYDDVKLKQIRNINSFFIKILLINK